jgi:hypothetical protein
MRTSNGLKRLIVACLDDERTFRNESRFVHESRRIVLGNLASERAGFAKQLRVAGGASHADDRASRPWSSVLRGLARRIRVAAGGPNSGDAIAECRHSQDRTEGLYDQVVGLPWSKEVLSTLREQRSRIHDVHAELMALQF